MVDVETMQANGYAERDAAEKMAARRLKSGATLGADKGYDASGHIKNLQALGVTPHVAAKRTGSAVPESIKAAEGYPSMISARTDTPP